MANTEVEQYIPSARDAIVGYFGRNEHGYYRAKCLRCNDQAPFTNTAPIYGDNGGN
jgi:hypothetical protein